MKHLSKFLSPMIRQSLPVVTLLGLQVHFD